MSGPAEPKSAWELLRDMKGMVSEHPRPTVVCLCGSTRFYREYQIANFDETMEGKIVLTVGFYPHSEEHHEQVGLTNAGYDQAIKEALDELHKRKINLADEVLVISPGGYVGESTKSEIVYAHTHGKPVRYRGDFPAAEDMEGEA